MHRERMLVRSGARRESWHNGTGAGGASGMVVEVLTVKALKRESSHGGDRKGRWSLWSSLAAL